MPIRPLQMGLFKPLRTPNSFHGELNPSKYKARLIRTLEEDLDFHGKDSGYSTHNFHAFPAKFPAQLPRKFIAALTVPWEKVLDPMSGSGTTVVEAMSLGRHGIGVDIDPLALSLSKVKVTPIDPGRLIRTGREILECSAKALGQRKDELRRELDSHFELETRRFVNYWFLKETQLELFSLAREIGKLSDPFLRRFFAIALSSIIITKSKGVSLAYDLAHTRPHRRKDKIPRSPAEEFERSLSKTIKRVDSLRWGTGKADIICNDAQRLGLANNSIDLIVTSPPYASNAIDYMRAHKFSLVWMGYDISVLSKLRSKYMGGERTKDIDMEELPPFSRGIVSKISQRDSKKGNVIRRYYSEMARCLSEMFRVLKHGKGAILVVGSSMMRGIDTETAHCLGEIGESVGFDLVGIAQRNLDRNKRMMPARADMVVGSPIEERMHKEYVIGYLKPDQE